MAVTIITIIQLIICIALITIVTLQSGKSSGLGVLSGGSDNFLAKNKNNTLDGRLASATKWVAIAFTVVTLVLNIIL